MAAGLTGLVLCGGKSSRMGTDKALVEIDGQSLLTRVSARLTHVCDEILVASGIPGRMGPLPYREIEDAGVPGPLGGIVAGLRASNNDLVAVVAVDMPLCDPRLLRALAGLAATTRAIVPRDEAGLQPLHAVYRKDAAADLLRSGPSVIDAVLELDPRIIEGAELASLTDEPRFAHNLNRPEDLERL